MSCKMGCQQSADKGLWLSTKENKMEESVGSLLTNPEKMKEDEEEEPIPSAEI